MTGIKTGFDAWALALFLCTAVTGFVPSATAQEASPEATILDLAATVLPLTATVLPLTATAEDMESNVTDLSGDVRETLARSGDIEMRVSGDAVILSVASDVLFEFDSAALGPKAQGSLSDIAKVLAGVGDGRVLVVGYTDAKGSEDYNKNLSERRAQAVADFLTKNGVSADLLDIEGKGEANPVAENEIDGKDNPEGRAKNRRVEFVLPKDMLRN